MRAGGSDHQGRGFFGELIAAWVVVIVVFAIGLTVASFHEPGTGRHILPHWYAPPVAGVQPPEDESLAAGETPVMTRPTEKEICSIMANSASYARAPASGAFVRQSRLPC